MDFSSSQIEYIEFSSVEFKEQVSFVGSRIKKLVTQVDPRNLFDSVGNNQRPLKGTVFSNSCLFSRSNIGSLEFGDETESGDLIMQDAGIKEKLSLHAHMKGNLSIQEEQKISVDFSHSIFEESIDIDPKIMLSSPKFRSCTFKKPFDFKYLKCEGEVDFSKARFEDEVIFGVESETRNEEKIKQKLVFKGATFKKRADFKNLIFTQEANFSNARFEDNVYFNNSEFKKEADFHESEYGRVACFYEAEFEKDS